MAELDQLVDNQELGQLDSQYTIYKTEADHIRKFAKEMKENYVKPFEIATVEEMEKGLKILELLKKMEDPVQYLDQLKEAKDLDIVNTDSHLSHLMHLILRNSEISSLRKELILATESYNQTKIEEIINEITQRNFILDEAIIESAEEALEKLKNDPNFANEKLVNIKKAVKNKMNK